MELLDLESRQALKACLEKQAKAESGLSLTRTITTEAADLEAMGEDRLQSDERAIIQDLYTYSIRSEFTISGYSVNTLRRSSFEMARSRPFTPKLAVLHDFNGAWVSGISKSIPNILIPVYLATNSKSDILHMVMVAFGVRNHKFSRAAHSIFGLHYSLSSIPNVFVMPSDRSEGRDVHIFDAEDRTTTLGGLEEQQSYVR